MRITGHRTMAIFIRYDITSEADKIDALEKTERPPPLTANVHSEGGHGELRQQNPGMRTATEQPQSAQDCSKKPGAPCGSLLAGCL